MITRTALVALLLALAIASLASKAEAAGSDPTDRARADEQAPAERPACRIVKVVYAGHGEAERAPCPPGTLNASPETRRQSP